LKSAFLIFLMVFTSAFAPIVAMAVKTDISACHLDVYGDLNNETTGISQPTGGDPGGGSGAPG